MKKILSIVIVMLFVLLSYSPYLSAETKEKIHKDRTYLISFNSYVDMEYNTTLLNEPLEIGYHTLPINISYWTNIPDFFRKIPFPINYLILFGQAIGPLQKIHLEILDAPDWANVYISSPDVLTDIPYKSEGKKIRRVNLIISLNLEAPPELYKLDIEVSCDQIKRLNGFSYQESIFFTPQYFPCITTECKSENRVMPGQTIHIPILYE